MRKFPLGREKKRALSPFATKRECRNTTTKTYILDDIGKSTVDKEKKREARSICAREKRGRSVPLISGDTRRISGLIRRRLTAPIRPYASFARRSDGEEEAEDRMEDEWR